MKSTHRRRGFSLVELSIVLVILGLLTGGILAGQSLIRAAELRSVTSDIAKHRVALQTFRDKYLALPGDMPNAQSFWGVQHATPATCKTTASTSALTCNGNGDGIVNEPSGSNELFRYFQHLANASLLEGSYSGIAGTGGAWDANSTNSPQLKISNAGISVYGPATISAVDTVRFEGNYPVTITMGTKLTNWEYGGDFIRAEEAWNIDIKLDDGKPAYGSIRSEERSTACNTSTIPATAEYLLTASSIGCALDVFLQ